MDIRQYMEPVACNICESRRSKTIFKPKYGKIRKEQDLIDKFRSSGDETLIDRVVKCKKCGLMYINPRIKPELIFAGYSEGEDLNFVSQAKGRELTFARSLKLIHKFRKGKKGRILDIGTAGGSFLHVARKKGWDVYGCEPNKWLCKWGKEHYGIDIKPGDVFQQNYPDAYFDVVTLWDVLEHTPDPKKALKECRRIMKPGGLLVVNYPDCGSWLARLMGRKWIFYLSVHLYYFTPKTIRKILARSGFKTIKIKPHIQTLGFGYLMWRMKEYSKLLHKLGHGFAKATGTTKMQIPYWLGQTLVIAKRKR